MTSQREVQLVNRCVGYIQELAEIYCSGGTDNRHILKDLKEIEWSVWCVNKSEASPRQFVPSSAQHIRWVDDIKQALIQFGGEAHLSRIGSTVRRIRVGGARSWPKNADACIRYTLETHCSNSLNYRGGPNLFEMVDRGSGYWRLKS